MATSTLLSPALHALLLAAVPAMALLAAAGAASLRGKVATVWRLAHGAAAAMLLLAAGALVWQLALGTASSQVLRLGGADAWAGFGLRADALGALVLLLVSFIGWVIVRYSRAYLAGEARERSYVVWLMTTLAAVAVVVLTNHLLVLALAWLATSLTLGRLLNFYGDRAAARIAAHKKFLFSRLADLCLFAALILIQRSVGSLEIDQVLDRVTGLGTLPGELSAAAVLIAATALLKCAALPFHGWLIQVMEAPTPVSALLHAGVVNLGGFVLIRLAPLISQCTAAQALLVVVGTATAVIAALVMTTRISIKVQLAWSTCAQMGFMLLQCGLGAYEMALLHLVAHSLYKAHAFLASGGAVQTASLREMSPKARVLTLPAALAALLLATLMVAAAAAVWSISPAGNPALLTLAVVVCMALTPLVGAWARGNHATRSLALAGCAFALALLYFGLHVVAAQLLPGLPLHAPQPTLVAVVLAGFLTLWLLQTLLAAAPTGGLARRLYPAFYNGLFLDERVSRLAFALWPPRLPATRPGPEAATERLAARAEA
ncbi:MAG TPA: NADH-quinone oxidoreductase subunit L [Burkholderiaceae bacterium]|nr:NADH-quinone oxidoreductase subunit L [Burkholderiaceae bacterium]